MSKLLFIISAAVFAAGFWHSAFAGEAFYQRFEANSSAVIGEFLFDDDYAATTTPPCAITINAPAGYEVANAVSMSSDSDGWYSYSFTASSTEGFYRATMSCGATSTGDLIIADKSFFVGPSFLSTTTIASSTWSYAGSALDTTGNAVTKIWDKATSTMTAVGSIGKQLVDNIDGKISNIASNVWAYSSRTLTSFGTLVSDIWSNGSRTLSAFGSLAADVWNDTYASTRKLTSRQIGGGAEYIAGVSESGVVSQVANEADQDSVEYDVDLIRGATFDFSGFADSGTTLTLVDSELSQPDDYWNNYRLKIMSGSSVGEEQTVVDFVAASDTITVSSAFSNPIASGDKYVLLHEDRLVYKIWNYSARTLTSFGTLVSDVWSSATRRLTDKALTDGGSLSTESYINTATSTIISGIEAYINTATSTIIAEVDANEALANSLSSDISDLSATTTLVYNKWGSYGAADIIGYVDEIESRLGDSSNATTTATIFGRVNLLQEKWGTETAQTIFNKANSTLIAVQAVQSELGYNGTSTTAYADLQLVKNYVDELENYIGDPSDTATSTLFGAIKDVRTKLNQLDTLETKLDTVDAVADLIRASQQLNYTVELSDAGEILQGETYRAKLSVWDYENNPANASSTPTIIIYDSSRATATSGLMTLLSTGVYEFTYSVPSAAANGLWETVASIDLGGASDLTLNDYWEVEGSPAQVIINSMSDTTVPSISANITITNEGNAGYEYQYEWCVVASQDNQCGGGDDVDYALAAKYLNSGQDWTTNLSATVSNVGDYWFKVIVYYGTEASGASRTFTATMEETTIVPAVSGGAIILDKSTDSGDADFIDGKASLADIYSLLNSLYSQVGYHGVDGTVYEDLSNTKYSLGALPNQLSKPLYEILTGLSSDIQNIGGNTTYSLNDVYEVVKTNTVDLSYVVNKTAELMAMLDVNRTLLTQAVNKPIIQTWFTEGSVILNIMVINPPDAARMVEVKEYLPKEIRQEHILEIEEGLNLEYDSAIDTYFVSGKIELEAGEKKILKVRAEDIFKISEEELLSLKDQAETLMSPLNGTSYFAQASILKSEIDANLNSITRTQIEGPANIEKKISVYRKNQQDLQKVKGNIDALKIIVSEASGQSGVFGNLFGVSTTMTWAIIIIVVTGIAVLMILLYTFLMRQRAMEYHISGGQKLKAPPLVDIKKHAVKIKGGLITYFLPPFGKPEVELGRLVKMVKILVTLGILVILILLGAYYFK